MLSALCLPRMLFQYFLKMMKNRMNLFRHEQQQFLIPFSFIGHWPLSFESNANKISSGISLFFSLCVLFFSACLWCLFVPLFLCMSFLSLHSSTLSLSLFFLSFLTLCLFFLEIHCLLFIYLFRSFILSPTLYEYLSLIVLFFSVWFPLFLSFWPFFFLILSHFQLFLSFLPF